MCKASEQVNPEKYSLKDQSIRKNEVLEKSIKILPKNDYFQFSTSLKNWFDQCHLL